MADQLDKDLQPDAAIPFQPRRAFSEPFDSRGYLGASGLFLHPAAGMVPPFEPSRTLQHMLTEPGGIGDSNCGFMAAMEESIHFWNTALRLSEPEEINRRNPASRVHVEFPHENWRDV